jgi:hypothetical protein
MAFWRDSCCLAGSFSLLENWSEKQQIAIMIGHVIRGGTYEQ